jgi:hypothetical protein
LFSENIERAFGEPQICEEEGIEPHVGRVDRSCSAHVQGDLRGHLPQVGKRQFRLTQLVAGTLDCIELRC